MIFMPLLLKENDFAVTIVMIAHNNPERFTRRLEQVILPTIYAHPIWQFQLAIIDNSDADKRQMYNLPDMYNLKCLIMRSDINLMYGPALNLAAKVATYPYLIY